MKKYFIIAAAAIVALASCTKSEIDSASKQGREINFSAVAAKATKAPITSASFSHSNSAFGVYAAYLATGTWSANYSTSKIYMGTNNGAGVSVSYVDDADKIWKPASTYYWPLQGNLTFFAYWPYTLDPDYAEGTNQLTFGTFTVASTVAEQIDVLVSDFTENQIANTATYTDGSVTSTVQGVPIQFKHMLSQVVFTAATDSDVYTSGLSFKINNITVGARGTSAGMTVVPGSTPVWADPTALTAYTVKNEAFPNTDVTGGVANNWLATTQSAQIGDALLMIPNSDFNGVDDTDNAKAENNNDDEYVSVTYTLYRMNDGMAMGQKTVKFWLNDNQSSVDNWEAGKKYTYQLTIGLEKIYFAPVVTEWVPESQNVTVPGNGVAQP